MDPRGNYSKYNTSGNIRDRGERHPRNGERGRRPRSPSAGRRNQNSPNNYRRDDPRSENYRSNRRDMDNSQMPHAHYKENSYNKQYSSSSLVNSNTNLLQSPFQNPYKIDSNSNNGSKDKLEAYSKLKKLSPLKFYISVIIAVILTAALAILGIIAILNDGLATNNIKDVTVGVAQGYLFYCGFMLIAIGTGLYAFIRKWNNLLVTYCAFLFVSCLYIGYFIIDLVNVKVNSLEVMNSRWKNDFNSLAKLRIENKFDCCGYYNKDDDPEETDNCYKNESLRKRNEFNIYEAPLYFNASSLKKRMIADESGCAKPLQDIISKNLTRYIIGLFVLLALNIVAVIVTILDIKQYADILHELSNPFA